MSVLFDYGMGGDEEWPPVGRPADGLALWPPAAACRPTFKDCAEADISAAFLNTDEHAEVRTVIYDGVTYKDIPVIEVGPKEGKRSSVVQMQHDFGQGLYKRSITIYCAEKDLAGNKPEQGSQLSMNEEEGGTFFHKFRVVESTTEMGMYRVKLEEVDE
ncbi:MAG: hypothetical protein HDT35_01005 [Clostridiales bacterium]|nr:hypothetical protein [Clostridiales bacterium]